MKNALLTASDNVLDASLKPLIEQWDDPPTALQILEVLDLAIHGALASNVIVLSLQLFYDAALEREKTTHEEVVTKAVWRNEADRIAPKAVTQEEVLPPEEPCTAPEDFSWKREDFFGAGIIVLYEGDTEVGRCVEGLTRDDRIVWTAFSKTGSVLALKVSLKEASEALIKAVTS